MRPDVRKPLILPVFWCISQNFEKHNFVKFYVLWLSFCVRFTGNRGVANEARHAKPIYVRCVLRMLPEN